MDSTSLNDLVFECIRAFVLLTLLAILFFRGSITSLGRHPGWKFILSGFCLITAATLIDITDEIPGLEKYVIIGDTIYEAFIEKLPGYLLGFVLLLVGFYRMIPSLQQDDRNEQALHDSEERLRLMFEANPDPVVLARLETGTVIDVNPGFELQIGFSKAETLGKNSLDLGFWADPQDRERFRSQLIKQGTIDNFEARYTLKNGLTKPGLLSARMINLAGETCILLVIRDITKAKEAERALLEVDRIRRDFISTAAHELRTPMTVLIGYSELLTDTHNTGLFSEQERVGFLEEIKEKGFILSQIVDDLLDLSRIDAGLKFRLRREAVNLDELLSEVVSQFRTLDTDHSFTINLAADESTEIECDRLRMRQVLENLLRNASKYSPPQSEIQISGRHQKDGYQLSVSDQGAGMSPEQVAKIFDKFYRVDSSDTAIAGLGLGMSIVKQIIDTHHGTVSIDSSLGKGTRVNVTLPKG